MKPVLWVVVVVVALGTTTRADSPHFIRASAALDQDGSLVVSWKEAGLGSNQLITYTASAESTALYQCVNKGGNCPAASNKEEVSGPVSATGAFSSGKNGSITGSLTVDPPPTALSCPGNQVVALGAVSYEQIALSDDTNGITAALPSALAVTFGVCP